MEMIIVQPLASVVADHLANFIIEETITPGEQLVESDLAVQLGVSRSPIREALRILEREGLVTIVPRKGAFVTKISREDVEEIYACRSVLNGLAAKLASQNMTVNDLNKFDHLILQMSEAAKSGKTSDPVHIFFELNVEFHNLVSKVSGNKRLHDLIQRLGKQTYRLRYKSLSLPGRMEKSLDAHKKLVEAFHKNDFEAAELITRRIIEDAGQALMNLVFTDNDPNDY